MKNSEEAIEKVLAELRSADAPAGMHSRITEALQDHASARPQSVWGRPVWTRLAAITPLQCGIAVAAILAVFVIIPAIHRYAHAPVESKTALPAASTLIAATPGPPTTSAQPPAPQLKAQAKARPITWTNAPSMKPVLDMDTMALDEMRAPSQPAPPVPLTEQEKLLLRITRNRNPIQLAALSPAMRAAHDAEEEADFERFFEPPKIGDSE